MPIPVAAAIVFGMIAGGGFAGGTAALQRLYRYFLMSSDEQDLEDQKLTPFLKAIMSALSYAKFGKAIDLLPAEERRSRGNPEVA